ncbi:hypothetical protein TNCV_589431 [Trichonephila clavipes]|nr:hypothetical protein TNCV_589431 [Trichonephila clavipes]
MESLKFISSSNIIIVEKQKHLKILKDKNISIYFAFGCGHAGVLGNERADCLAKVATLRKIDIAVNIPNSFYKKIMKERMTNSCNQEYLISNNGSLIPSHSSECNIVGEEIVEDAIFLSSNCDTSKPKIPESDCNRTMNTVEKTQHLENTIGGHDKLLCDPEVGKMTVQYKKELMGRTELWVTNGIHLNQPTQVQFSPTAAETAPPITAPSTTSALIRRLSFIKAHPQQATSYNLDMIWRNASRSISHWRPVSQEVSDVF